MKKIERKKKEDEIGKMMLIKDSLLCPAEAAARAGRRKNLNVCVPHVGQRQCISLQSRALL